MAKVRKAFLRDARMHATWWEDKQAHDKSWYHWNIDSLGISSLRAIKLMLLKSGNACFLRDVNVGGGVVSSTFMFSPELQNLIDAANQISDESGINAYRALKMFLGPRNTDEKV